MLNTLKMPFAEKVENKSLKGLTLLESLLVLSLISIMLIGAVIYFNSAQNSQKVTATSSAISTMSAGVKDLYRGQSNYTSLTTEIAIRSGKVPADMIQSPTEIRNSWGGDVIFTGNSRDFEIELNGLDFESCLNMTAALTMTPTLIYGLQINTGSMITTPSIDPGVAMTECVNVGTNTLTYSVR